MTDPNARSQDRAALPEGAVDQAARHSTTVLIVAVLLTAAAWLLSGISTVEPGHRAVVLRFGAVDRVASSGLLLCWPAPIERVVLVPDVERSQSSTFANLGGEAALRLGPDGPGSRRGAVRGVLSGDAGLVQLRGTVVWTVTDPMAYVVAILGGAGEQDPERFAALLRRSFSAAAIQAAAGRSVDGLLAASGESQDLTAAQARERLRGDVARALDRRLEQAGLGITVRRVDLQVELPEAARPAFAQVASAIQQAEREVAEARTSSERLRQDAQQFRIRRLAEAEAAAREALVRARVETQAIAALSGERDVARRQLLRERLYRDGIEAVLRKVGGVIAIDRRREYRLWLDGEAP